MRLAEFVDEMAKHVFFGSEHRVDEQGGVSQLREVHEDRTSQLADSDGFGPEHLAMGWSPTAVLADAMSELVLEHFEGRGLA